MKTFSIFFFACATFLLTGCLKSSSPSPCTPNTIASEEPTILAFASNNGIFATKDANGLYYEIITQGSGPTPTDNSRVFVTYTASFLNGAVFDQQTNSSQTGWVLGQLIAGLEFGLKYIQKGGRIKLIVPSSLAYGCKGTATIPTNSILYFDIQLVDVQ